MKGPPALVGFSGLVGGNLARQRQFGALINSANSATLRGGDFGHVVFSAARAEKWRANADPDADARHIEELIDLLGSFRAETLTLISTVDVYPTPAGVDEADEPDITRLQPYGRHRLRLEHAAVHLHPNVLVARLPALFGPGLKKNVVFDLMHGNQVERIQPDSSFQWYDLRRLADDLDRLWAAGGGTANLVTEPLPTAVVVAEVFRRQPLPRSDAPAVTYDVRTCRSDAFDTEAGYLESRERVLARLRDFVLAAAPG